MTKFSFALDFKLIFYIENKEANPDDNLDEKK